MNIIIIGGGAAGYFAAIRAAELAPEAEVSILERGKEVLGKVKISGGGRCNVTHACWDPRELVAHYPRGQKALRGPFHHFGPGDTVEWFESRGVPLKVESDGRMFPTSDSSQSIIDCLQQAARQAGVKVITRCRVERLEPPAEAGQPWRVHSSQGPFQADRLMVATGSNPQVWKQLQALGHSIVPPVPSLFTFNIKDERIQDLPGISVPHATLSVSGSKLQAEGPLLLTHWGMSGPAILKLSAWGARELHALNYQFELRVNWLGTKRREQTESELRELKQRQAKRFVSKHSSFQLPARLWHSLLQAAGIPEDCRWADLNKAQLKALSGELTEGSYAVHGKSTFKEEFVTCGGVALKEVDFRTMASRKLPGLYFAGEVLDIDAITGGFNFQAAWTGGYLAGTSLAQ
jgi:predicted Rossmann fold flavoprotein